MSQSSTLNGFTYRFVPGTSSRAMLVLHGTGGDETQMLPLAQAIDPAAVVLSPRGKVLEGGAPRFFRRLAEGVFDVPDLKARTEDLADFITAAAVTHKFDIAGVTAVGFSNGANIAGGLLLLRPETLTSAILIRPMIPFVPAAPPKLIGKRILILAGEHDTMTTSDQTESLAKLFQSGGAAVTLEWVPSGHGLTQQDINLSTAFLKES
jgi:predicted esterase